MALTGGSALNNLTHTTNKLRITQVDNEGIVKGGGTAFSNILDNAAGDEKVFEVQINPDKYQQKYSIAYTVHEAQNKDAPPVKNFHHVRGKDMTLNFTLDGTGVIPASLTDLGGVTEAVKTSAIDFAKRSVGLGGFSDTSYVTKRIEALKRVVYDYNPNTHETPIVIITWGDVPPFTGRLADLQVNYTLFSPNGAPLRAEIQLQFGEHQDASQLAAANPATNAVGKANVGISSPDLTHRRTIKATDTLPLLCEDIYKDAAFYWQVAQANNLTHFRDLKEGIELFFPPIER